MDHAVPQGMDQGMDRGVWIVCGFRALIHTLYFDSYPYIYIYTVCLTVEICWAPRSVKPSLCVVFWFQKLSGDHRITGGFFKVVAPGLPPMVFLENLVIRWK